MTLGDVMVAALRKRGLSDSEIRDRLALAESIFPGNASCKLPDKANLDAISDVLVKIAEEMDSLSDEEYHQFKKRLFQDAQSQALLN